MSDGGETPELDVGDGAPVDFERLSIIAERLGNDARFARIEESPPTAPERLVCVFDSALYPVQVDEARLDIVWFENGTFSIHYHESHAESEFDHRWDRHPSTHNALDHIHPGPDAPTPGEDTSHPADWRDVLAAVLSEVEDRQRGFWTD
ncbi:hypothetical protein J2752_002860 [Halarchaeum rubridurum]|uniref:Uncharacterized protein n=1 Tax=Halarchaeum rubridurum TaxID=489911 RepID=A0A830G4V9_9EURY|nr:hypothetical protein [Halarchaeum rubridurum]MBP1955929.1 hypothetical protein [Halarchaeum rubridurum]GGM75448.1 hypothetical protein GCM10009017_26760 [Halarchaeum rubridurum]